MSALCKARRFSPPVDMVSSSVFEHFQLVTVLFN
jgi:hypothetical protein